MEYSYGTPVPSNVAQRLEKMHDLWKPTTEQWIGVGLLAGGVTLNMWAVGYSVRAQLARSIDEVNRRLDRLEQMIEQTTLSMSPRYHNYGDEI